jgi:acyl-coenzyme A thioesterase PaaI-like protein
MVTAKFRPCPEHIGFKGVVHGGITATVLDEIMVWACVVATRKFAYCAELNVRYLKPLAPDLEVTVTSELVADRRGRIFEAKATVLNSAGEPLVQATGKYMPIREADTALMMADFIGDASWVTQLGKLT